MCRKKQEISVSYLRHQFGNVPGLFLGQLIFWFTKTDSGIDIDGQRWIYNTLEQWAQQLHVSSKTIWRAVKSLKDNDLIVVKHLSPSKRNRTAYYAVNWDTLNSHIKANYNDNTFSKAKNDDVNVSFNDHNNVQTRDQIDVQISTYTNTKLNKSNKSKKISKKDSLEQSEPISENKPISSNSRNRSKNIIAQNASVRQSSSNPYSKPKNTTAQDMLAIWNGEMKRNDSLTPKIARYLVAALQQKFENSMEAWRKYLKRIKTSAYLMGEKFILWLSWVLKFSTIDQILAGGFFTKEPEKPLKEQRAEAEAHIASLDEEPECLQIRRNFVKYHGPSYYMTWLAKATLRKITVQYHNRQEELLAVAVESNFAFERLRTQYLESYVTEGLSVDSDNHFQKPELLAEKVKTEITKQEQPETATDDWKSEYESQMQGNNLSAIYPGFSEEIDNFSGEYEGKYEPSMQFVQPWPRREGENSPTLARGINQKQPIASVEDCCAMLIQNLSSKRPPLVKGGA